MMHLLNELFCSTFLLDCSGKMATASVVRRPFRLLVGHIDEIEMNEVDVFSKACTMVRGYLKSWFVTSTVVNIFCLSSRPTIAVIRFAR